MTELSTTITADETGPFLTLTHEAEDRFTCITLTRRAEARLLELLEARAQARLDNSL